MSVDGIYAWCALIMAMQLWRPICWCTNCWKIKAADLIIRALREEREVNRSGPEEDRGAMRGARVDCAFVLLGSRFASVDWRARASEGEREVIACTQHASALASSCGDVVQAAAACGAAYRHRGPPPSAAWRLYLLLPDTRGPVPLFRWSAGVCLQNGRIYHRTFNTAKYHYQTVSLQQKQILFILSVLMCLFFLSENKKVLKKNLNICTCALRAVFELFACVVGGEMERTRYYDITSNIGETFSVVWCLVMQDFVLSCSRSSGTTLTPIKLSFTRTPHVSRAGENAPSEENARAFMC